MERDISQIKEFLGTIMMKLEALEERVAALEEDGASKPKGPEPILTCVQCLQEYKESENADGHCKYHSDKVTYEMWKCTFKCCSQSAKDLAAARLTTGCTKGKHFSRHHKKYPYAEYFFHMKDLSKNAKELWLEMDVLDHVTELAEWAEVGQSKEGTVFVLLGCSCNENTCYAEFTVADLKKWKKAESVLEASDPVGWKMAVTAQVVSLVVKSITVSIKPASSSVALVKRIELVYDGDTIAPGATELLSDPSPPKSTTVYSVSEGSHEGRVIDPGEDLSKDRKIDYPTETNDDMFAVEMTQVGNFEVDSSHVRDGKWNNLFTAKINITNSAMEVYSVMEVTGEYMNKDGKWVRCNGLWIAMRENQSWLESNAFTLDAASPFNIVARFGIELECEQNWSLRRRAHFSLPQPLHFRLTLTDSESRTASLRCEQGNPPLPLPTRELREKNWNRKEPLLLYVSADDTKKLMRSDAALFYDERGMLCFRPSPNENASQYFYLKDATLQLAAYKAKKAGQKEFELDSMRKEQGGSRVSIYAVIDLDNQIAYGLKVVITTPTSNATECYLLPQEDFAQASISSESEVCVTSMVAVRSSFTVTWSVSRASKYDRIELFPEHGSESQCGATNRQGESEGSVELKAPPTPGSYQLRYYPGWLKGSYSSWRHDTSIAEATLTVTAA